MFYSYPIAANANNWLHGCLCAMLADIHNSIGAGKRPPKWPQIIPEIQRPALKSRTGLRERLKAYQKAYKLLGNVERQQVVDCLAEQNQIQLLVECKVNCKTLDELPITIQQPIVDLFDYSFYLLTPLGIRDKQYEIIYNSSEDHVCPFCGCECFDAPEAPREDLDHYLLKSIYPFAAANLNNLVPMGQKCNKNYKHDQDLLRTHAGVRRSSFYPFAAHSTKISLDSSVPFGGGNWQMPSWKIDFHPNSPECTTWDDVFHVRERLIRDVLDPSFPRWLKDFVCWYKLRINVPNPSRAILATALKTYAEDLALMGFTAREFLRATVFSMLHKHCAKGNVRLNAFMSHLVTSN